VTYRDTRAELHRLTSAELIVDHGRLAQCYPSFQAAEWLARFVLANVLPGIGQEGLFTAFRAGLGRLSGDGEAETGQAQADSVVTGVLLAYLQEAGWLADHEQDEASARQCRALLEMAAGRQAAPRLTASNWRDLRNWAAGLARAAECQVPDGG